MDPREIFPEEIWETIFGQIDDSQDWLNLFRSSSIFESVAGIRNQKDAALFPKVLAILNLHLHSNDWLLLDNVKWSRLVSPKCAKAVDSELEAYLTQMDGAPSHPGFITDFGAREAIDECLDHFENCTTGANPFLGGRVGLHYPIVVEGRDSPASDDREGWCRINYRNGVNLLLNRFGSRIRRLELTCTIQGRGDAGLREFGTVIRRWIPLLPELKRLDISIIKEAKGYEPSQQPLSDHLVPFPELVVEFRQLEVFMFYDFFFVGTQFQDVILAHSNPKALKRACITRPSSQLKKFVNLERLEVTKIEREHLDWLSCETNNISWPLKHLKLSCDGIQPTSSFPLDLLVRAVNRFAPTLISFQVTLKSNVLSSARQSEEIPLDLPVLRKLVLKIHGLDSLNSFATGLPNLEKLVVQGWDPLYRPRPRQQQQVVKTWGLEKNMYRSNVWQVFPKLETFEFTSSRNPVNGIFRMGRRRPLKVGFAGTYSRKGYELHCLNNINISENSNNEFTDDEQSDFVWPIVISQTVLLILLVALILHFVLG